MTYSEALYKIETGSVWINKKTGGCYMVLGIAEHSETELALVIYTRHDDGRKLWARPAGLWLDKFIRREE